METMSKAQIVELNDYALRLPHPAADPVAALAVTARHFALTLVHEDGGVMLYRDPQGSLVNCWVGGEGKMRDDRIEDGGLGFDDQVGLHEQDEDE